MKDGKVIAICVCPVAGGQMISVEETRAIAGAGLEGDRYCTGQGSFSKKSQGRRQVTLFNGDFLEGTAFVATDTRRNIITSGVELMYLIGREFQIGEVRFRGLKYCEPCTRPSKLTGKPSFMETFQDRGGLIAEILSDGHIKVNDQVVPPPKDYKP